MITVCLDMMETPLSQLSESWLVEQILRRRADCVRVKIRTPDINAVLATAGCPSGGGGRSPNTPEKRILDLWARHKLNEDGFAPGQLLAFLKQIEYLC